MGPSATLVDKGQILGVAAHIKAASSGGARYDSTQSEEERHSVENGLWLCESCAKLIDNNKGADFSIEQLRVWKIASEKAAYERLLRHSDAVRYNCVESLIFINVPRLQHYVALYKQQVDLPLEFINGIPGDGFIAPELNRLKQIISRMRFPAMDWQETIDLIDDPTGMIVSFEGQFWTKNGPRGRRDREERDLSDYKIAPHVYSKRGSIKFILPYDPKYVTTNTATVEFNNGRIRIGGFAQVKFKSGNEVVASPYIIGLASTPQVRAFWNALSAS